MRPASSTPANRRHPPDRRPDGATSSRSALESLLGRHQVVDYRLSEDDDGVTLRFALNERYVQLIVALPDRYSDEITRTPSGKLRAPSAQERAYEREVRRRWHALLLVLRGKLVATKCGVSALEDDYDIATLDIGREPANALRTDDHRSLRLSRAVVSLFGLAVLIPASSLAAFAVPPTAVERLITPVASPAPDVLGTSAEPQRAALGATVASTGPALRTAAVESLPSNQTQAHTTPRESLAVGTSPIGPVAPVSGPNTGPVDTAPPAASANTEQASVSLVTGSSAGRTDSSSPASTNDPSAGGNEAAKGPGTGHGQHDGIGHGKSSGQGNGQEKGQGAAAAPSNGNHQANGQGQGQDAGNGQANTPSQNNDNGHANASQSNGNGNGQANAPSQSNSNGNGQANAPSQSNGNGQANAPSQGNSNASQSNGDGQANAPSQSNGNGQASGQNEGQSPAADNGQGGAPVSAPGQSGSKQPHG